MTCKKVLLHSAKVRVGFELSLSSSSSLAFLLLSVLSPFHVQGIKQGVRLTGEIFFTVFSYFVAKNACPKFLIFEGLQLQN